MKKCPECTKWHQTLQTLDEDVQKSALLNVPQDRLEEIWPAVRSRLTTFLALRSKQKPSFNKWTIAWSVPTLAVAILLFILLPKYIPGRSDLDTFPVNVIIESAEIDGEEAQIAIVERDNPKMTFIWMEKAF